MRDFGMSAASNCSCSSGTVARKRTSSWNSSLSAKSVLFSSPPSSELLSAEERGGQWTVVDMVEVYFTRKTQAHLSTLARFGDNRWEVQMLGALPFLSLFHFSIC